MNPTQQAVFVVGADGVGKTETTKALSDILGIPRFKCPAEKEMFREGSFGENLSFDLFLPHFVEQTKTSFVSDRGYPCEWVYSQVFKRSTDHAKLERIDELWSSRGGLIVLLIRSEQELLRVQDDLIPCEFLPDIQAAYRDFLRWTKLPHVVIETEYRGSPRETAHEIARWLSLQTLTRPRPSCMLESTLFEMIPGIKSIESQRRVRLAYLHLVHGTHKEAFRELTYIDRDTLPQEFWEALGRSW